MKIVTSNEMQKIDERATRDFLISQKSLMENAGAAVVRVLERLYPDLSQKKILIVAGKGKNAGDGFVVARLLKEKGRQVVVCLTTLPEALQHESRLQYERLREQADIFFRYEPAIFKRAVKSSDLMIDALFGTGIHSPLRSPYLEIIREINCSSKEVISIDIPSGIDGNSGKVMGAAVSATHTITFGLPKIGFFCFPGQNFVGRLHLENIGFPKGLLDSAESTLSSIEEKDLIGKLSRRSKATHKGEVGHLLMIAGSRGKMGAAVMTALAAFRSGSGLITLLTDRKYLKAVFPKIKEAFIDEFPEKEADLREILKGKDVSAIGPGIGFSPTAKHLVQWTVQTSSSPVILDADALNIISKHLEWLKKAKASLVLTPHPGEMARLVHKTSKWVQQNRLEVSASFAKKYRVFVVLKGASTVIANPKGEVIINSTGNPAMATAGMGDVLTGMIASFIGQGMTVADALTSAVFLHGKLADEWVQSRHASRGLIASDLIEALPRGIEKYLTV